jgi:hypothetical protein
MQNCQFGQDYGSAEVGEIGRRYWYRTSGLFRVKEALYP